MEKFKEIDLIQNGISEYAIIDKDGFSILDSGINNSMFLEFGEMFSALFRHPDSRYIIFDLNSTRIISFPLAKNRIFIGSIQKDFPSSRTAYFADIIAETINTYLEEL